MKLGLDIHGVIDKRPEDFASLAAAVIWTGGEVHIITGGSVTEDMKEKVKTLGVAWTHFFSEYFRDSFYRLSSVSPFSLNFTFVYWINIKFIPN